MMRIRVFYLDLIRILFDRGCVLACKTDHDTGKEVKNAIT